MVNKKLVKILFLLLTLMMIILAGLEVKNIMDSSNKTKQVSDTKEIGPYTVSVKQNDLEKEVEKDLEAALKSKKRNDILREVSRYFVADYFSLNDKKSVNDIGGLGFVLKNNITSFKTNAINSYYGDIPVFQEVYGVDNLPVVVEASTKKPQKYDINQLKIRKNDDFKAVSAYSVVVNWKYEENEALTDKNIVNSVKIVFVKADDDNYYVFALEGVE